MTHVTVMEWQRVLLFVDGRLERVLEPGRHRYRAKRSELVTVEMRPRMLNVTGQELITQDGISLRVSVRTAPQISTSNHVSTYGHSHRTPSARPATGHRSQKSSAGQ
jgi:hypothetical protein